MSAPSLQSQADACELECLNIRGWIRTVTAPEARIKRTAEEIALRRQAADNLEAAAKTIRGMMWNQR